MLTLAGPGLPKPIYFSFPFIQAFGYFMEASVIALLFSGNPVPRQRTLCPLSFPTPEKKGRKKSGAQGGLEETAPLRIPSFA